MVGLTGAIDAGLSGIMAATDAIETTSSNTANANTSGYAVERPVQVTNAGNPNVPGSVGDGTDVLSIGRGFNQYAYSQMVQATSAMEAAQTVQSGVSDLSGVLPVASGGAGGLGSHVSSFFDAASTLSQDPASLPDRTNFLSQADTVAAAFRQVGGNLQDRLLSVNQEISSAVDQINGMTSNIAGLNAKIAAQSADGHPPSNALLDRRDALVQKLGQQVGVSVLRSGNLVSLYLGGNALVEGAHSYSLATNSGTFLDGNVSLVYKPTGNDVSKVASGGKLAGYLSLRSELEGVQGQVGGMAAALASAVNTQQSLGLDQNGALGKAMFSVSGPEVFAASGNGGSGSLSASITNMSAFKSADYILTYGASGFTAENVSTGQTTALGSGSSLSLDGMTIGVSGTPSFGDSFEIKPSAGAAESLRVTMSDPSGIAAASAYVGTPGVLGSGGTISDANSGSETVSVGTPTVSGSLAAATPIVGSGSFGQNLTLRFTSSSAYEVLNNSGSVVASGSYSSGAGADFAISYPSPAGEVVPVQIAAGNAVAGDSFALRPGGGGSNGNMVSLAGLRSQDLLGGNTLSSAYSSLVTSVGDKGSEAQAAGDAAKSVFQQAQTLNQAASGVNLDTQAADLVKYQQAYQAAARVIAVAQSMFNDLVAAVG